MALFCTRQTERISSVVFDMSETDTTPTAMGAQPPLAIHKCKGYANAGEVDNSVFMAWLASMVQQREDPLNTLGASGQGIGRQTARGDAGIAPVNIQPASHTNRYLRMH